MTWKFNSTERMLFYLYMFDRDMEIQQHKKNVLLFLNSWQWHENSTTQKEYFVILNSWEWHEKSQKKRMFCYF